MGRIKRVPRPSPAMVVACLALVVAVGGVSYAAIKLPKNSVRSKQIRDRSVQTRDLSKTLTAPNAAKLGGTKASGYQRACDAGAIKASIVVDPLGMAAYSSPYQTVTGFNCGGGEVQIRRASALAGDYYVRFVGGAGGTGSAVVTTAKVPLAGTYSTEDDPLIGERVFRVRIFDTGTGMLTDNTFTLLAF